MERGGAVRKSEKEKIEVKEGAFELLPSRPGSGGAGRVLHSRGGKERLLRRRQNRRVALRLALALFLAALVLGLAYEIRTSALQAHFLSRYAARLSFSVVPGPSSSLLLPRGGPLDITRGYTRIVDFQRRLEGAGFRVVEQAEFSPELQEAVGWGLTPPYSETAATGLVIWDRRGVPIYSARSANRTFTRFEEIPELIVQTLAFIENRELLAPPDPRTNPVVEWDRLARAAFLYAGSLLGLPWEAEGGSTLATQIEKYRHSPGGRTDSPREKLRQIASASLKVYRSGPDTRAERQRILLEYLNTMPLGGAPGYGELYGLGDGLYAWFGLELPQVVRELDPSSPEALRARAFKHVLALIAAVRAPTRYLIEDRAGLEERVRRYLSLLYREGLIEETLASRAAGTRLQFLQRAPVSPSRPYARLKDTNLVRTRLLELLGIRDFYELDRLDLEVEATLDRALQTRVEDFFEQLKDPDFLAREGLLQDRLLAQGDPNEVVYSLVLYERTPQANLLRVHADTLNRPFDLNRGMKLELGSTAKLRALAHCLEILAELYQELSSESLEGRAEKARLGRDPLTRWAAATLSLDPHLDLAEFLQAGLQRRYSASPREAFFTGGGIHYFNNFDSREDGLILSVQEAFQRSTNLVFIRLMKDLVEYHRARLPYDADEVLQTADHPERKRLLREIADEESRQVLIRSFRAQQQLDSRRRLERILGSRSASARHLSLLFFAWHPGAGEAELEAWLRQQDLSLSRQQVSELARRYGKPYFTLADYGYLLGRHPLELWCADQLNRQPDLSWSELLDRSEEVRRIASSWLFNPRNRKAQDLRLRIRIEQDAFRRMAPYWQKLGFSFGELLPSYATAIGSASDRPAALAELMGIILNDGVRLPRLQIRKLALARNTPYHTVLEASPGAGDRLLDPVVARTLRQALAGVVEQGTARRLAGSFRWAGGSPVTVGGKTGSGDNRVESVNRAGQVISSRARNRTASFVFYIGDRFFGVITAYVEGPRAEQYNFTSALPVTVLKLLAPALNERLWEPLPELPVS